MNSPARRVVLVIVLALFVVGVAAPAAAQTVFINEIHYDNAGTDTGEAIEIAGPAGTDLTGWSIVLYNGPVTYDTDALSGTIPNTCGGFGVVVLNYPTDGIQNGGSDGIALVGPGPTVIQFLSYEGVITATNGPANGMTSTNIGVSETNTTTVGFSLQLSGTGSDYTDFTWQTAAANTFGSCNTGQTFVSPDPKINEFVANHTGTDNYEFIEIFGPASTNFSAYTIISVEGDSTGQGIVDRVIPVGTTNAAGFWWTGSVLDQLENGTTTLLLVEGFSGAAGNDLDTNNDGTLDVTPWTRIVDAIAVNDGGASDLTYLAPVLAANYDGQAFTPGGASRIPDGADTNAAADWVRNDFDLAGIPTFTGTPVFGEAYNTPGATNLAVPADAAPTVTSTVPANGATNVATNTTLTVNFSESVNVAAGAFTLSCTVSGSVGLTSVPALPATGVTSVVLTPASALSYSESCTATVLAASVADTDGTPTQMAADYAFSFTTAAPPPAISLIHDIQGLGATSTLTGQVVRVRGIVVGDYQGASPALGGFFVQEEDGDADADPATSEGVFAYHSATAVAVGDLVEVTGTVTEFGTAPSFLTELSSVSLVQVVSSGNALPTPASVTFPVPTLDYLERFEGMLVTFPQPLTVIENYELGRYGSVALSGAGRLPAPTHAALPGAPAVAVAAANDLSRIVLDDALSGQNPDPVLYPAPGLSAANTLRSGSTVTGFTGVFDERFDTYRLQPVGTVTFTPTNPRPTALATPGTRIRAVSFNTLNYFNGDGVGGGFPTARGANTLAEFNRQRAKTIAAILALDADVLGLIEIENDDDSKADAATSAIEDLVNGLNAATAPGTYDFVATGVIGGDAIRSAIAYKPGRVTPVGAWAALTESVDPDFLDYGNRPTLAQTFDSVANGARFTFVVNHLRSKNCSDGTGGNADSGDGQGCWNLQRTNAANAVVDWLATDPTGSDDPDFLVVGDMNSYRYEDPITALRSGGFTDLVDSFLGDPAYSYIFDGEAGYMDHALSSAALEGQVGALTVWHNNTDEPSALDYNIEFKSVGQQTSFYAPDAYRASDHDPVVVDIDLAVNAAPTVDAGGPYSVSFGFTTTLTATASDPNGDALTVEWDLDNNGSYETPGTSVSFPTVPLAPGTYTVGVRATETASEGLSATDTATVTVVAGPAITSPATTLFVTGTARTFTITTTGFPAPAITLVGTLPAGLTFVDNGDGTATISGTAATGTAGTYTVTVTASNGVGTPFIQTLTIQVTAAASVAAIPVLDGIGLGLFAALVALGGALLLGRRLS